jgi:hypothetical protein
MPLHKGDHTWDGLVTLSGEILSRDHSTFTGLVTATDQFYLENLRALDNVLHIGLPGTPSNVSASGEVFFGSNIEVDGTLYINNNLDIDGTVDGRDISVDGAILDSYADPIASGVLHVHNRTHEIDSVVDHSATSSANYGKYVRANSSTGAIEFATLDIVTDHGDLTGLSDDDHSQYLLANGTRPLSSTWAAGNKIFAGALVDDPGPYPLPVYGFNQSNNSGLGYLLQGNNRYTYLANNGVAYLQVLTFLNGAVPTISLGGGNNVYLNWGNSNAFSWLPHVGFTAGGQSMKARLIQAQDTMQAVHLVGSADATGDVACILGTKYTDAQLTGIPTLVQFATNANTDVGTPTAKHEFYSDGSYKQTAAGGATLRGLTSATADPTTTEFPNDKDWGLHKNTASGDVFLVYNDGGVIKKVTLS